ncbi:hypothetical protein SAMN04488544_3966 [Microlunatus sagamiharensis]|uniref:Mannosyltransferase (PIG-V) n=1 Tax=Microlunatus sagamiharensis TaxID=546874 RepID=A0A1H2NGH9_9ACTN|nr:hypothetical protein [Microlunatus sagamiharensis]SDV04388.1 hypothetical protein SAMN04488544_3966 [Microlunatus sagamiharensis]
MPAGLLALTDTVTSGFDRGVEGVGRALRRFSGLRWWVQVLLLWVATRLFSVVVVLVVARQQGPNPWSPSRPGYFAYIDGWDAGYYNQIFDSGYPSVLPRGADGIVEPNRWAFYPVFPGLARAVSAVTGLGWVHVAPLVASLASLGLALVLYRLFLVRTSPGTALFAVGLYLVQAAAPVLGFGYAESLGLLLVASVLLCVERGRYLTALPLVLVASLTRPTAAPLALALGLLLVVQLLTRVPRVDGARVRLLVLVVVSGLCVAIWPVAVAVGTGDPDAYLETESGWHGGTHVLPGELWARVARRLFGDLPGLAVVVLVVLALVAVLLSRPGRRLGLPMWLWTGSYLLYLIGVAVPNGSSFRFALGAFPLFLAVASASAVRSSRVVLVVLGLVLQVVWVAWLWHWSGTGLFGALEANP